MPLMLQIVLNILFLFLFNFKTHFFYILTDDSLTDFLKRFIFCYIILIVLITLRQNSWLKIQTLLFISNNVKGIQNSLKLRFICNWVLFLQEIHSFSKYKIKRKDKFLEHFFLHGKTNSWGLELGYTKKICSSFL